MSTLTSDTEMPDGAPKGSGARRRIAALEAKYGRTDLLLALLVLAGALIYPWLPGVKGWMLSEISFVVIYIIAALGVAVLVGYTGLVSVGHGGFLAIGAYTSALLTKYFEVDLVIGVVGGGLMSGLIGALLALVFLRLSGAFMAIGTLGFAFFVGAVVNNVEIFEGRTGISLPRHVIVGFETTAKNGDFAFYHLAIVCLALVALFFYALGKSGTGRAFMALRDAEKAAMASGVNRLRYRTLAFAISAAITGVAGALNGHISRFVSSEVYADVWYSVDVLVAVVVGGGVVLAGPFLGGMFVALVPFFFETLADFAFILKGVVLILVLRFAPSGIAELIWRPVKNYRNRLLREAAHSRARRASNGGA